MLLFMEDKEREVRSEGLSIDSMLGGYTWCGRYGRFEFLFIILVFYILTYFIKKNSLRDVH